MFGCETCVIVLFAFICPALLNIFSQVMDGPRLHDGRLVEDVFGGFSISHITVLARPYHIPCPLRMDHNRRREVDAASSPLYFVLIA